MDLYAKGKLRLEDSLTEKILDIWNELIKDRILFSEGALKVQTLGGTEYPIKYLSSGEKSIFYFLACIFLKRKSHIILLTNPRTISIRQLSPNYGISLRNTVKEVYLST